ncbi:MAG: 1-acyl-sn-glycerol-3-phosphate acyltransferase [Actinomycetota bacterium]|nr:1-acyl-sn-glycerol-3-phosphate acyltransferase [Actinomycetota bacterium]
MGAARRALRLLAASTVVIAGALGTLPLPSRRARERSLRCWFRVLLAALQVRTEVRGATRFAPQGVPVLVVSNHVSWLDVFALGAVQPLRLVGKSEVRDWALVGVLARRAGTLFIDRERLSALPATVGELADALRAGSAVAAFPEGTTYCGGRGGEFRPAVFQAALDAGVVVRPVALRYRLEHSGGPTTVASFVGDATLWQSVRGVAGVRGLVVEVRLLPTLDVTQLDMTQLDMTKLDMTKLDVTASRGAHSDRRALAAAASAAVRAVAEPPRRAPSIPRKIVVPDRGMAGALPCHNT